MLLGRAAYRLEPLPTYSPGSLSPSGPAQVGILRTAASGATARLSGEPRVDAFGAVSFRLLTVISLSVTTTPRARPSISYDVDPVSGLIPIYTVNTKGAGRP